MKKQSMGTVFFLCVLMFAVSTVYAQQSVKLEKFDKYDILLKMDAKHAVLTHLLESPMRDENKVSGKENGIYDDLRLTLSTLNFIKLIVFNKIKDA